MQNHAHLDIAWSKEQQISRWGSWAHNNLDGNAGLTTPLETERLAYDAIHNQPCQALPQVYGTTSHQLWSSVWAYCTYLPCTQWCSWSVLSRHLKVENSKIQGHSMPTTRLYLLNTLIAWTHSVSGMTSMRHVTLFENVAICVTEVLLQICPKLT